MVRNVIIKSDFFLLTNKRTRVIIKLSIILLSIERGGKVAVADKTIDPKILASARAEFLKKGFEGASLKDICAHAGVTTGALYKRYAGKDELFCAVVRQTVEDLDGIMEEKKGRLSKGMDDKALMDAWYMDFDYMMWWFDYLYQRYDDYVLLLKCAAGSSYGDFTHLWVERMTESTYAYYEEAYRRGISKEEVSREEMHILLSAFWTSIYEPFVHGMKRDQIENHCRLVCRLFDWQKAFEFTLPGSGKETD